MPVTIFFTLFMMISMFLIIFILFEISSAVKSFISHINDEMLDVKEFLLIIAESLEDKNEK